MSSISSGQSTNESSSTPNVMETPENGIINAISGVASGLSQQMLQWGQSVFAKTSQITDQAVGNFFNVSQQMQGLSNNLTDQYNNIFAPQNASLAREADSYNSAARQAVDMGQAGATQAQAGDAGMKNSEAALRSYGIDPSSGRYAALDKAAAVQNAANVAGAENTQRNADAATGMKLRSEAVQVGATLPAAIANVNNTAIQANTGASNATLANANTGRNLMSLPNDYLKTAMEVKLPPTGNTSQSKGQSTNQSTSATPSSSNAKSDPSGGGGGSGAGHAAGGGSGGGGGPAWMPQHGGGNSYSDRSFDDYSFNNPAAGVGSGDFQWAGNQDIYQPGGMMGVGQPGSADQNIMGGDYGIGNNPFQDPAFGQTWGGGNDGTFNGTPQNTNTEWGNISYDPSQNTADPGWGQTYDQPAPVDWVNGTSGISGGGGSTSTDYGTSDPSSDYYAGNYGGGTASDYGGAAYKLGGAIPQKGANRNAYKGPHGAFMADGGQVDPSMSPSGGQQVDDVQAQGPGNSNIRLNADEFVIPNDVAKWKGQEFFQKLIMDSRKRFQQAPAHGQQG